MENYKPGDVEGPTPLKETSEKFKTRLEATIAACNFVTKGGADIKTNSNIQTYKGRLGSNKGKVIGIESTAKAKTWFRIRCDYDPDKGFHFNGAVGKDGDRIACIVRADGQKPPDTEAEYKENVKWLNQSGGQPAFRIRDLWRGHN